MAFIGGEDSVLSNALMRALAKKGTQTATQNPSMAPQMNREAGTVSQPVSPFYFGPNIINPTGAVMNLPSGGANPLAAFNPQTPSPMGPVATPAQAQIGKLQTFMQQLQDPTRRMELVTMLGQTQPAPQDQEIQTFFADLGGTPNATG